MTHVDKTRTLELLADRATMGLGTEEQAELDAQLASQPELDDDSFELAAAAVELAYTDVSEPLPQALRQCILGRAEDFYGALSVVPVTITLDEPPEAGKMQRWETRIKIRQQKHEVVISFYDIASGKLLFSRLEVDPSAP